MISNWSGILSKVIKKVVGNRVNFVVLYCAYLYFESHATCCLGTTSFGLSK